MDMPQAVSATVSGLSILFLLSALLHNSGYNNPTEMEVRDQDKVGNDQMDGSITTCHDLFPPEYFEPLKHGSGHTKPILCASKLPSLDECRYKANAYAKMTASRETCPVASRSKRDSPDCHGEYKDFRQEGQKSKSRKYTLCDWSSGTLCWQAIGIARNLGEQSQCGILYPRQVANGYGVSLIRFRPNEGAERLAHVIQLTARISQCSDHSAFILTCKNATSTQSKGNLIYRYIIIRSKGIQEGTKAKFHIRLTILPSMSRDGFYLTHKRTLESLRALNKERGKVYDFSLYQPTAKESLESILGQFSLYRRLNMSKEPITTTEYPFQLWRPNECSPDLWGEWRTEKSEKCNQKGAARQAGGKLILAELVKAQSDMNAFICAALLVLHESGFHGRSTKTIHAGFPELSRFLLAYEEFLISTDRQLVTINVLPTDIDSQNLPQNTIETDLLLSNYLSPTAFSIRPVINLVLGDREQINTDSNDRSYWTAENEKPLLLFTIPFSANKHLQDSTDSFLRINANRLVTTADVRETILWLLSKALRDDFSIFSHINLVFYKAQGLSEGVALSATEVSSQRTCASLDVRFPVMCVCEGEWVPAENDTVQVAKAEYAVASLNSKILQHIGDRSPFTRSPYGNCLKLYGIDFYDVQVRREEAQIVTKMVVVATQKTVPGWHDITEFLVLVAYTPGRNDNFSFKGYRKLTNLPEGRDCANSDVDPGICQCIPGHRKFVQTSEDILRQVAASRFGLKPTLSPVHEMCLILTALDFGESISFSIANVCPDRSYNVKFSVYTKHVISSGNSTVFHSVPPFQEQMMLILMKSSYYRPMSSVGYRVFYNVTYV